MPEQVSYRILERQTADGWTPFAVAYRRGDRFVLFHPVWRAHRALPVASLDELRDQHFPSSHPEWRWSPVQTCAERVTHPIDLLQRAFAVQPAPESQVEAEPKPQSDGTATPLLDAIRNLLPRVPQPATAREGGTRGEEAAAAEEPPLSLDALTQDLQNDPAFFAAVVNLRVALADPQIRSTVLEALEAFARAARPTAKESE